MRYDTILDAVELTIQVMQAIIEPTRLRVEPTRDDLRLHHAIKHASVHTLVHQDLGLLLALLHVPEALQQVPLQATQYEVHCIQLVTPHE